MYAVYFIGNGFDIACGLDTSARSIISQYREELERLVEGLRDKENANPRPYEIFLKSISEDPDSWADFEMQLGQIAAEFDKEKNPAELFELAFRHFREFLVANLSRQQEEIGELANDPGVAEKFAVKLFGFLGSKMRKNQRNSLNDFLIAHRAQDWMVDLVVFNYTYFIDQLVEQVTNPIDSIKVGYDVHKRRLNSVVHIHGNLFDEYGIIVGVDNQEQIKSDRLRKDVHIADSLIKPNVNEGMGELRDVTVAESIDRASIIIVHGMSIGESDKTWWQQIGRWLSSGNSERLLVLSIFSPKVARECQIQVELYKRSVEEAQERFLDMASIPQDSWETCRKRILVVINADDFNVALAPIIRKLNSGAPEKG